MKQDENRTCWRDWLIEGLPEGETIIHSVGDLDKPFDYGFGSAQGPPFTAWSETRVFFPCVYDGAEWIGDAPRNPCEEALPHQGGE